MHYAKILFAHFPKARLQRPSLRTILLTALTLACGLAVLSSVSFLRYHNELKSQAYDAACSRIGFWELPIFDALGEAPDGSIVVCMRRVPTDQLSQPLQPQDKTWETFRFPKAHPMTAYLTGESFKEMVAWCRQFDNPDQFIRFKLAAQQEPVVANVLLSFDDCYLNGTYLAAQRKTKMGYREVTSGWW